MAQKHIPPTAERYKYSAHADSHCLGSGRNKGLVQNQQKRIPSNTNKLSSQCRGVGRFDQKMWRHLFRSCRDSARPWGSDFLMQWFLCFQSWVGYKPATRVPFVASCFGAPMFRETTWKIHRGVGRFWPKDVMAPFAFMQGLSKALRLSFFNAMISLLSVLVWLQTYRMCSLCCVLFWRANV